MTAGETAEASPRGPGRGRVALGLTVALAIVAAVWFVGGRGLDRGGDDGPGVPRLPRAGQPAPDFAVTLADGRQARLSDFRGRPVWLNFWGSWCAPCREELPAMQAAYEQLAPQGLVLLAVALDESLAEAAGYATRHGATYLVAADPDRSATGAGYPIPGFPTHIVIDADGVVRDVVIAELDTAGFVEHAKNVVTSPEA